MNRLTSNTTIQYVAEINGVKEITLIGSADPHFWRDHLKLQNLSPYLEKSAAKIMISAMRSKWKGVPFEEFIVSIFVAKPTDESTEAGVYLPQAFNSVRFFAFCERTFFHTPYDLADIEVVIQSPTSIQVGKAENELYHAVMAKKLTPLSSGKGTWQGAVFLPGQPQRMFYAKIDGQTDVHPFSPKTDSIILKPAKAYPIIQALIDSQFTGQEWHVRMEADHAKSKTYLA